MGYFFDVIYSNKALNQYLLNTKPNKKLLTT